MSAALLAALAGLYLWALAAFLHTPGLRRAQRWARSGWRRPLVSCPWCFGFWVSIPLVALLHWGAWGWIVTPAAVLASAAIIGVVGSNWTQGFDEEDGDGGGQA